MTQTATTSPIIITRRQGILCAVGPEADILAAVQAGRATITGGRYTGDTVPVHDQRSWVVGTGHVATPFVEVFEHDGRSIAAAEIDMDHLTAARAPILHAVAAPIAAAYDAKARGDRALPACDNCGDCRLCV